jgi:tetratricopeptide (TPR) repeat protein
MAIVEAIVREMLAVTALVMLVIGSSACSSSVKRGAALYADGQYIEAAEVFERTEHRLNDSAPRQRAEYALYRGLTLLVLGDLRNSHRWLGYAYQVEKYAPGSLGSDGRTLLDRGWFELGQRLRDRPQPAAAPTGTALASSQPPEVQQPTPAAPDTAVTEQRGLMPQ